MHDSRPAERDPGAMKTEDTAWNRIAERLVILLSHERSGSHYLAEMLVSGSEIVSLDEVCNFDAVDPDKSRVSFFGFRREWQTQHPDLAVRPDAAVMNDFLDAYFVRLLELINQKKVLLDIKYGHVHNFEPGWWPSEMRPLLLRYLARRNIRAVHLTRHNSMAAVLSAFAAESAGVSHRRAGSESAVRPRMRVPVPIMVQKAITLHREKENFFGWLAGNRCFNLTYEEISGADSERERSLARLCAFLEIRVCEFASTLEKMTLPIRELVENYGELRRVATTFGVGGLPPTI